jgi:hypothetical protein
MTSSKSLWQIGVLSPICPGWTSSCFGVLLRLVHKSQHVSVNLLDMRCGDPMRSTWIIDRLGLSKQLSCFPGRIAYRNDLVVLTVKQEGRDIKRPKMFSEVGLREGFDAFVDVLHIGLHTQEPDLVEQPLRDLGPGPISAIKQNSEVFVELGGILGNTGA